MQIKHLTQADIPYLATPCYITDSGEVYQWCKKEQKMAKRKVRLEKNYKSCRVSLRLTQDAPNYSTDINLPSLIYRSFSNEKNLPERIFINYKDKNPMNLCIDNLYRTDKYEGEPHPPRPRKNKRPLSRYGLQQNDETLMLSDIDSVICFLKLKMKYCHKPIAKTDLIIDMTGWSNEDILRLENTNYTRIEGVSIKK